MGILLGVTLPLIILAYVAYYFLAPESESDFFKNFSLVGRTLALLALVVATIGVGSLRTGVFNVADVAVMLGACILAFANRRPNNFPKPEEQRKQS